MLDRKSTMSRSGVNRRGVPARGGGTRSNHSVQSQVTTRSSHVAAATASTQPRSVTTAASTPATTANGLTEDDHCIICMDDFTRPKKLGCGHTFCTSCIDEYFRRCQKKCPTCGKVFGVLRGNQPSNGTFKKIVIKSSLSGYEGHKTIQITYTIPNGIQTVSFCSQ